MPGDAPDPALLARFVAGECTPAERAHMAAWLAANPDRQGEIDAMRALAELVRESRPRGVDPSAMWSRVRGALEREEAREPRTRIFAFPAGSAAAGARGHAVGWWRPTVRVAAAVLFVVGGIGAWRAGWFAAGQPVREIANAAGSRTTVTLRDGTRLVLGPASSVRVPADFGVRTRTVELNGEALFTVVHDARRPFAVRTDRTVVRDVGTTFSVRAYRGDPEMRVVVAEGEVALPGVALRARDVALVGVDGVARVDRGVELGPELAWVQGGLVFRATPLSEAAREIGRAFGMDVTVGDTALGAKPVTAAFADEPVDVVLDIVSRAAGGHVERHGRAVVIRGGVGPADQPSAVGAGGGVRLTRAHGVER